MNAHNRNSQAKHQNQKATRLRSLTLILVDWENYEVRRSFMRSQHLFREHGWEPNVVFADSRYTDANATGDQVASLIRNSKADVVAVVEDDFVPARHLVSWLAEVENSDIHCIYRRDRANKPATNFLLNMFSKISKTLLRVGKTCFKPGMVAFVRGETTAVWSADDTEYSMTRFLARARLNKRIVHETELSPRQIPMVPIKTRHVNKAATEMYRFWWNEIMFPQQQGLHLQSVNRLKYHAPVSEMSRVSRQMSWVALIVTTMLAVWFSSNGNIAVGGLATAATVFASLAIGKRLVGFRAALIGALCVLASTAVVFAGAVNFDDAVATFLTTILFLASYLALFKNNFSSRWWTLASLAAGVGVLVKGPLMVLLCVPPLAIACWLSDNRTIREPKIWISFSLTCAIIAGAGWVASAYGQVEAIQRLTEQASATAEKNPVWYYLPVLFVGMFPASLFLPTLFRYLTTRKINSRFVRTREHGFLLIAALWTLFVFSLMPQKTPSFILPVVPLFCLLIGWLVDSTVFTRDCRLPHWVKVAPRHLTVVLFAMLILTQVVGLVWFQSAAGISIVAATCLAGLCIYSVRRGYQSKTAWIGLAAVAIMFSAFTARASNSFRAYQQPLVGVAEPSQANQERLSVSAVGQGNDTKIR